MLKMLSSDGSGIGTQVDLFPKPFCFKVRRKKGNCSGLQWLAPRCMLERNRTWGYRMPVYGMLGA